MACKLVNGRLARHVAMRWLRARIFNNVFYNPTALEWSSILFVGAHNAGIVVKNNVFVDHPGAQTVLVESGGDVSLDHNVYYGGGTLNWHGVVSNTLLDRQTSSGQDINSFIDAPMFEDPPSDLHVPAISPSSIPAWTSD